MDGRAARSVVGGSPHVRRPSVPDEASSPSPGPAGRSRVKACQARSGVLPAEDATTPALVVYLPPSTTASL
jgi:hypothetical protein